MPLIICFRALFEQSEDFNLPFPHSLLSRDRWGTIWLARQIQELFRIGIPALNINKYITSYSRNAQCKKKTEFFISFCFLITSLTAYRYKHCCQLFNKHKWNSHANFSTNTTINTDANFSPNTTVNTDAKFPTNTNVNTDGNFSTTQ